MSRKGFAVSRQDGRSNAEVLIAAVQSVQPGDLLSYESLASLLGEGTDRTWQCADVQSAVSASLPKVRRVTKRTLIPVVGKGYRVPFAHEHVQIARRRDERGVRQFKHSLETLKNTKSEELSHADRVRWEAQLSVNGALFTQVALVTRRQQKQDEAIAALFSRVGRLEGSTAREET